MRAEAPTPAAALARIRAPFLEAGAAAVEPPVIQPLNQLLDLAGEAMRARLFIVQDEGGREACLRPDFTVPVARLHCESRAAAGRYRYEGKAFRVAPKRDSELHPEEFVQLGLEVYGEANTPRADAAMIELAWRSASAGGRKDLRVRLGDRELLSALLDALGINLNTQSKLYRILAAPESAADAIDRLQSEEASELSETLRALIRQPESVAVRTLEDWWRANDLEVVGGRTALEVVRRAKERAGTGRSVRLSAVDGITLMQVQFITDAPYEAIRRVSELASSPRLHRAFESWNERVEALVNAGIPYESLSLSPAFGRAFGYYDGFLFEIASGSLPADAPIAAGGRYDGLLAQIGGPSQTAVGCIVRPARAWNGQ